MEKAKKNLQRKSGQPETDLVLKKHVGLIHCENKLTLIQRKICNILLFNALDKINDENIHEISFRQLCSLVGYRSNDINLIKKSLKSLISVVMEWNLLDDNKFLSDTSLPNEVISWHASALLAGASIEKGLIRYSYSPQIKTVLSSLEIYGRINLFVQAKFNSSYSLVLYENCVRFKNIKQTSWFNLDLFRSLMGVAKDKYPSFKEFKRNVITIAVNEINQKSDIFIEPEYRKRGRQIAAIRFLLSENESYKPSFKKTVERERKLVEQSTQLDILLSELNLSEKQAAQLLAQYDAAYVQEKIALIQQKTNIKNKSAYLQAALKNDYKADETTKQSTKKETENSHLRELREASQVNFLRRKYMEYKFKTYYTYIDQQAKKTQKEIQTNFMAHLQSNTALLAIYKKKEFKSPFLIAEFIKFIEAKYISLIKHYLSFDDYITAEEDLVS